MFLKSKVFLYTNKYPRVLSRRVFKWTGSRLSLLILAFPGYWNWSCAQFPQRPSSLVLQMCLTGKAGAQALFPICTYSGCRSCVRANPFSPSLLGVGWCAQCTCTTSQQQTGLSLCISLFSGPPVSLLPWPVRRHLTALLCHSHFLSTVPSCLRSSVSKAAAIYVWCSVA